VAVGSGSRQYSVVQWSVFSAWNLVLGAWNLVGSRWSVVGGQ